jgi:hypothetical protein
VGPSVGSAAGLALIKTTAWNIAVTI